MTERIERLAMVADSPSEHFNANVVDSTNSPPIAESWCLTQVKVSHLLSQLHFANMAADR